MNIKKLFAKKTEMHIFHGGCCGCTMQQKKGLGYCVGCMFFEGNWDLPDLNDEHKIANERMELIRDMARLMANKNK